MTNKQICFDKQAAEELEYRNHIRDVKDSLTLVLINLYDSTNIIQDTIINNLHKVIDKNLTNHQQDINTLQTIIAEKEAKIEKQKNIINIGGGVLGGIIIVVVLVFSL